LQGDALRVNCEPLLNQRQQGVAGLLLPGIVPGQRAHLAEGRVGSFHRVAVMRQEAVAAAHDEPASGRLGIGQAQQQFLNLRQSVVRVGQPTGLLRLLAGVAIEQRSNRKPNGQRQDKSGNYSLVECIFHQSHSAAADLAGAER